MLLTTMTIFQYFTFKGTIIKRRQFAFITEFY